jgi:hypothetical protein
METQGHFDRRVAHLAEVWTHSSFKPVQFAAHVVKLRPFHSHLDKNPHFK